ncbi:MAG: tetratricopeptide repeat protein [Verrucomicrobia bacterium]|nr:tetratricopeptide repeat protein [Verrucomicrobiota bacterium]
MNKAELSPSDKHRLMEQFVALGYLEKPGETADLNAASTERENNWTLTRSYLDAGQFLKALPILEDLYFEVPERTDFAQTLALCQAKLGLHEEAAEVLNGIIETASNRGRAALILAQSAVLRNDYRSALEHLEVASGLGLSGDGGFLSQKATVLFRLGQYADALSLCYRLLEIDPENSLAHYGLAYGYWKLHKYKEALGCVEKALALKADFPIALLLRSRIFMETR